MRHPAKVFHEYWLSLAGGELPDRSSFQPMSIPSVLRWFMIFRQEMDEENDLYHLFLQGKYLHEFTADQCFYTRRELMRAVLKSQEPGFARITVEGVSEFSTMVTVGMFPMSEGDKSLVFVVPAPETKHMRALL